MGQHPLAVVDYRTALELSREIGDRGQEAEALTGLGDALRHLEGEEAARTCWVDALTICEVTGKLALADDVRERLKAHVW